MRTNRNHNAKKKEMLAALEKSGGLIATACKACGMSRDTYYQWYAKDADFREKADDINERMKDFVESKLMQNIKSGDTTSIIFYAKTKMKDRGYTERQEIDLSTDGIIKVDVVGVDDFIKELEV